MDRFDILIKEVSLDFGIIPSQYLSKAKAIVKRKIELKGKLVILDKYYNKNSTASVYLEMSPRSATCKRCCRIIAKETERYSYAYKSYSYWINEKYHKRCLPYKARLLINYHKNRDKVKEAYEDIKDSLKDSLEDLSKEEKRIVITELMKHLKEK